MSSAIIDSVPSLYRALAGQLVVYLRDHFRVVVRSQRLAGLQSYLVTSPRPSAPTVLVLGDHVSEAEKVYLLTHTASHLLLGHAGRPFATIVEPRRIPGRPAACLDDWRIEQELHADALTGAILWGSEPAAREAIRRYAGVPPDAIYGQIAVALTRSLSGLLLGHKHRGWQAALVSNLTRKAVLHGLRFVRAIYHRSGTRRALAHEPVIRDLREVYCLTELVSMAPDLLSADRPRPASTNPRRSGAPQASAWLDISETTPFRAVSRDDRSRLN